MSVIVLGGTGFVGSYLVSALAGRGIDVDAASRHPETTNTDVPESVGSVRADVSDPDSLEFDGYETVVNLVGLSPLFTPGGVSYHQVHVEGTKNVVKAAEDAGVERYVHMSALGADPGGSTEYIRTKGVAENYVKNSNLDYHIFKPSVIFGDGDEFISQFKDVTSKAPFFPLVGGGRTRFQPVYVEDLAEMMADAATGEVEADGVYEIGGPEVLTLKEVVSQAFRYNDKKPRFVPVPMIAAKAGLSVAELIPFVPVGVDQYRSLKFDNTTESNDAPEFGYTDDELTSLGEYLGVET
ncbi:complex I NDUFA9 subunit family protein [Halorutilales archaeon Cl-col2-1]